MNWLEYYENKTKTLREHLILIEDFVRYVKTFEEVTDDQLYINCTIDPAEARSMYVIPYPYKKSVYRVITERRMASDDGFNGFQQEDKDEWVRLIHRRLGRILKNRVHEDTVAYLDDNPYIGIFLNKIDGHIAPFSYLDLSGVDVVSCSIHAQSALLHLRQHTFHGTIQEYKALEEFFYRHMKEWSAWVNFRYDDLTGDPWHTDNDPLYLVTDTPFDESYCKSLISYIQTSIEAQKKVIAYS